MCEEDKTAPSQCPPMPMKNMITGINGSNGSTAVQALYVCRAKYRRLIGEARQA